MYITIKHLHNRITINDLEDFVKPRLKGFLFQPTANLHVLKIIGLMNRKGKIVERHGLLRISPESANKRLIKNLSKDSMQSKNFAVTPYMIRHWNNDRRNSGLGISSYPNDQRIGDRRRKGLKLLIMNEITYQAPGRGTGHG